MIRPYITMMTHQILLEFLQFVHNSCRFHIDLRVVVLATVSFHEAKATGRSTPSINCKGTASNPTDETSVESVSRREGS
uniref:Uncharacterized protein n=1 Tax=Lepeophtheirus salmonis TaxID=72036 RepID=A0A0K2UY93_LEPSM